MIVQLVPTLCGSKEKKNSVAPRGCSEPAQINVNRLSSRNLMNARSLGDLVIKTLIHHDEVTMYKEILDR